METCERAYDRQRLLGDQRRDNDESGDRDGLSPDAAALLAAGYEVINAMLSGKSVEIFNPVPQPGGE